MSGAAQPSRQRVLAAMASFGIVILMGAALALYMCTGQAGAPAMTPSRAVALGLAGAAVTFVVMLAVTLATTLAGLADAAEQLRSKGKVSIPSWMKATVSARMALVYVMYGCLGFAIGGSVAATIRLLYG